MNLAEDEARRRFGAARVARLATADVAGQPHLVPVTFAVKGDIVVVAVDHKPKTTANLKRLRNIKSNPHVSLLVDEFDDEDWSKLWWVRADGTASIIETYHDRDEQLAWLVAKYDQYKATPPSGPMIWTDIRTWRGWAFTD
ncbi:MAG: TIGR03668 family PPOX class F420-dependent oxidoreductase [Pseudonocardiaceae bacterium]